MVAASITVGFSWLAHGDGLEMPMAQTQGSAGRDLRAAIGPDETLVIAPGRWMLIPCGFAIALPEGYEAQVRPRSGLAAKFGVTLLNAPGTIDSDYRGEVKVNLINHGENDFTVRRGDRIAQMVIAAVQPAEFKIVDVLDETARGRNGFGSTGHVAAE